MFAPLGEVESEEMVGSRLSRVRAAISARPDAVLLVAVAALAFALLRLLEADRVAEDAFLGPDGRIFTSYVARYQELLPKSAVSRYAIWRALPVGIVSYTLSLTKTSYTSAHIVRAFTIYNVIVSVGSAALLLSSLRRLRVSFPGRALGVAMLVLSYPWLKQPTYHAAIIDSWALFAAFILVRAYLSRSRVLLAAAIFAAMFTWPYLFVYLGAPLLALLPGLDREAGDPGRRGGFALTVAVLLGGALVLVLALLSLADYDVISRDAFPAFIRDHAFYEAREGYRATRFKDFWHLASPSVMQGWLPVSAALLPLAFLVPAVPLVRGASLREVWRAASVPSVVLMVLTVALAQKLGEAYSEVAAYTEAPLDKVRIQIGLGLSRPLLPTVAHFSYFGVMVAALVAYFRPFVRAARAMGIGYRLVLVFSFGLLIMSETRQQIPVFALILVPLVKAIDDEGFRWPTMIVTAACGVVVSKVLLPWESHDPRAWIGSAWKHSPPTFLDWPLQRYYMNIGPVIAQRSFLILLAGLVVTAAALYAARVLARARPASAEADRALHRGVARVCAVVIAAGALLALEVAVRGPNIAPSGVVQTARGPEPRLVNGDVEDSEPFIGGGAGDAVTLDLGRERRVWDVVVYGGGQKAAEGAPSRLLVGTDPSRLERADKTEKTYSYLTPWRTRLFGRRVRYVRVELAKGVRLRLTELEVHGF